MGSSLWPAASKACGQDCGLRRGRIALSNLWVKNENVGGISYHKGITALFCTAPMSGISEIKCSRNFNEICSPGKRKELWKSYKKCGGKRDALMLLFIRYCDLEVQVCFCHFLVYQVKWLICCFSFMGYGIEVISEAQNQMVFLAVLSDSSCSAGGSSEIVHSHFSDMLPSLKSFQAVLNLRVMSFKKLLFSFSLTCSSSLQFLEYFQLHLNVHICDKCLPLAFGYFVCTC